MKGWMYILQCSDASFYVGSTNDIERRLIEHLQGMSSNYTKKRLPVKLIYFEEFMNVAEAFYREKQVQGWSRRKKIALMERRGSELPALSLAYRDVKKGE